MSRPGRKVMVPGRRSISTSINADELREFDILSKRLGMSRSALLARLAREAIRLEQTPNAGKEQTR